jgi:hypothetical protein
MQVKVLGGSVDVPGADAIRPRPDDMLGLAIETLRLTPINGLRYPPENGSCGWYIWGGDVQSLAADFYTAIQARELSDYIPDVAPYLNLPPGYRFTIPKAGDAEVWLDEKLLR